MKRREFRKSVSVEIVKRATDVRGVTRCEECKAITRRFEIHHVRPDAMEIDKSAVLTAAQGLLLCEPCHAAHTKEDVRAIAKAKRIEANALRVATAPTKTIQGAPFPKSAKAAARAQRGHREPVVRKRGFYVDAPPSDPLQIAPRGVR